MSEKRRAEAVAYRGLYSTAQWKRARLAAIVRDNATCSNCGKVTGRVEVHHKDPHRGDRRKFFDIDNLTCLCPDCHKRFGRQSDLRGYHEDVDEDGYPTDPAHPSNA